MSRSTPGTLTVDAGRGAGCRNRPVEGYTNRSYGAAFADVYDDWYGALSDAEVTADVVASLAAEAAGDRRPCVVELAVGTGRLAVRMARRGLAVVGVDSSPEMLERLR